jgi:hypothetical protein
MISKVKGSDMQYIRTMKRLNQGHLHPLLQHPWGIHVSPAKWTWVACVAGEHSSKELFEHLKLLLFRTYIWLPHCMWELLMHYYQGCKLECRPIANRK